MPISKKTASVILRALSSGVVPSRGAEQIAVGRREEVSTFEEDLENAAEGSGTFRFIIGSYGSGKTFMTQLIRARALDKGFAVMNADLTPANRMRGSGNEGAATYRLLMSSLSVRGMADGGALESVIQGWFQSVRDECAKDPIYQEHPVRAAESGIRALTSGISQSGLLHDFQSMLVRYYVRSTGGHDSSEIVKWFDGSCCSLKEARELGAENCVREDNWFLFLKIWADFFVLYFLRASANSVS